MEQKREIQVVMLPTEKAYNGIYPVKAKTMSGHSKLISINKFLTRDYMIKSNYEPQHLYFTSDEDIKIDDWVTDGYSVWQWKDNSSLLGRRKIIASTNESLGLPSPSQAFIQKYCEQGGINKVLVEYVNTCDVKRGDCCCSEQDIDCQNHSLKLKIDSHNTISTFPIKDNSEHIYHINQLVNHLCSKIDKKTIDIVRKESTNWINENL